MSLEIVGLGIIRVVERGEQGPAGSIASEKEYTQIAHGFTDLLTPVHLVAGVWTPARADDLLKLGLGLIVEIFNVDTIKVAVSGFYNVVAHGLTADSFYYLADTGGLTDIEPDVSQPFLYVIDADNILILPYRPEDFIGSSVTGIIYLFGNESTDGSWRFEYKTIDGGMCLEVRLEGVWTVKGEWSQSFETDALILSGVGGSLTFRATAQDERINLLRPAYTDGLGFVLGNPEGKAVIYSNTSTILHKIAGGEEEGDILHDGVVLWPRTAYEEFSWDFVSLDNALIETFTWYVATAPIGTMLRIGIKHTNSGVVLWQNTTMAQFLRFGKGESVVVGENIIDICPDLPMVKGESYTFFGQYTEDVEVYGNATDIKIKLTHLHIYIRKLGSFPAFDEDVVFDTGDIIWHLDTVLSCKSDGVTGPYDPADWEDVLIPGGDMFKLTYDPTGVAGDTFAMDNMVEGALTKILTADERTAYGEAYTHSVSAHNYAAALHEHDRLKSADGLKTLNLDDSFFLYQDQGTPRLYIDPTYTQFDSPDGLHRLKIDNTGAYYNDVIIGSPLTGPQQAAIDGAASPTINNVFATMADIVGGGGGSGDMLAITYDPTNVAGDAFDMENMIEGALKKILTPTERAQIATSDTHALSIHDTLTSPNTLSDLIITDSTLDYQRNGSNILALNTINSALKSPSNQGTKFAASNTDIRMDWDFVTRVEVTDVHSKLISPGENTYIIIKNTKIEMKRNSIINFLIDSTKTQFHGPDRSQNIKIDNTAAYYNGSEILVASDAGVKVAELVGGLVPEAQLPAYVDEVLEGYLDIGDTKSNGYDAFYEEVGLITIITPAASMIYIDINFNTSYRWTGNVYAQISSGLVLGELVGNAYRGDRGKLAYDHSLLAHDFASSIHIHNDIESPDGLKSAQVTDTAFFYNDGSVNRIYSGASETRLVSNDGNLHLSINNGGLQFFGHGGLRFDANSSSTLMKSPDGLHNLTVSDFGAFYDGVEIGTGGGGGGATDRIVSADTLSDLIITNDSLEYLNGVGVPRLRITTTKSELGSPLFGNRFVANDASIEVEFAGQHRFEATVDNTFLRGSGATPSAIKMGATGFELNDGTIDRIFTTIGKTVIASPNDVWWSGVYDDKYAVTDNARDRILVDSGKTSAFSPNGLVSINTRDAGHSFVGKAGFGTSSPADFIHLKGGAIRIEHSANASRSTYHNGLIQNFDAAGLRRSWMGHGNSTTENMAMWNDSVNGSISMVLESGLFEVKRAGAERIYIDGVGNRLRGPDGTQWMWLTNGSNHSSEPWLIGSDRRIKENIEPLSQEAITFINNLKPVSYNKINKPNVRSLGLIAQDVEEVQISDIVNETPDGTKGVAYTELIAPLIAYVQDLQKQINELTNQH